MNWYFCIGTFFFVKLFFGTFFKQRFAGGAVVVALCSDQTWAMNWLVVVLLLFISTFIFGTF